MVHWSRWPNERESSSLGVEGCGLCPRALKWKFWPQHILLSSGLSRESIPILSQQKGRENKIHPLAAKAIARSRINADRKARKWEKSSVVIRSGD